MQPYVSRSFLVAETWVEHAAFLNVQTSLAQNLGSATAPLDCDGRRLEKESADWLKWLARVAAQPLDVLVHHVRQLEDMCGPSASAAGATWHSPQLEWLKGMSLLMPFPREGGGGDDGRARPEATGGHAANADDDVAGSTTTSGATGMAAASQSGVTAETDNDAWFKRPYALHTDNYCEAFLANRVAYYQFLLLPVLARRRYAQGKQAAAIGIIENRAGSAIEIRYNQEIDEHLLQNKEATMVPLLGRSQSVFSVQRPGDPFLSCVSVSATKIVIYSSLTDKDGQRCPEPPTEPPLWTYTNVDSGPGKHTLSRLLGTGQTITVQVSGPMRKRKVYLQIRGMVFVQLAPLPQGQQSSLISSYSESSSSGQYACQLDAITSLPSLASRRSFTVPDDAVDSGLRDVAELADIEAIKRDVFYDVQPSTFAVELNR
jgi:hypothetical protein